MKLGFLASHGGSNARAIIEAYKAGRLLAEPTVVISNNSNSPALAYAREEGLPHYHLSSVKYADPGDLDHAILGTLLKHGVNIVILAGYMKKIGPLMLGEYSNRILNIHPSLLPKHGGKNMFGKAVHASVLESGDTTTGVTIHLVNEEYDQGPILAQFPVPVHPSDDVDTLAARVLEQEHLSYAETINRIAQGELKLNLGNPGQS
ncbi:phosphoribosylglycinamide formyltransferase [Paenibacillus oenotherae]|uniref:Phosphoribosylglycinamide formyltransferase n=2 Tax=Paenibacillus oenotherae TaxID=1435645 RepID=A0ABS7DER9_9BACL|nr:phosphoribosylglycinamide formyltransferase [Paenibacillus oenotherae]